MRHALVGIAIVASVVGQERPDFSGTWTYDVAHSTKTTRGLRIGPDGTRTEIEFNSPPPPIFGAGFTAKQDAKTLSLSLTQRPVARMVNGRVRGQHSSGHNQLFAHVCAGRLRVAQHDPIANRRATRKGNGFHCRVERQHPRHHQQDHDLTAGPTVVTTQSLHLDSNGSLIVEAPITIGTTPQMITMAYTRKR